MQINPGFAVRGVLFASLIVVLLTTLLTANTTFAVSDGSPSASSSSLDQEEAPASEGDCQVSAQFPKKVRRWCDLITRYAAKHNLPPDLIAALIWQESGGKAGAYSKSGAVGLMQIMPRDGIAAEFRCPNGPCFAKRPSINELQDPEFNIQFGTRMLAGLVKRRGSLREALKAYGPMDSGYYYADKVLAIYEDYRD